MEGTHFAVFHDGTRVLPFNAAQTPISTPAKRSFGPDSPFARCIIYRCCISAAFLLRADTALSGMEDPWLPHSRTESHFGLLALSDRKSVV